jgi:hypothetical protein
MTFVENYPIPGKSRQHRAFSGRGEGRRDPPKPGIRAGFWGVVFSRLRAYNLAQAAAVLAADDPNR